MNAEFLRRVLPAVRLVVGTAMLVITGIIVVRMLVTGAPPLTGSAFLDGAFAVFFFLRGVMYFRQLARARAGSQRTADGNH
jgi:hypothetical protein